MMPPPIGTVTSIDEVIAAMRALDRALPDRDGVKWFNLLYLRVTEAVSLDGGWEDWPFLQRFDVAFAQLYFDAIAHWEREPERTPRAWRPLLSARYETGRAPIQFALAGMNAHINRDLAVALIAVAGADGSFPSREGARFNDFQRVNSVLERAETAVREQLATGVAGEIDRALGDLDSVLMMWNVRTARESAWSNGELLWHLRDAPRMQRGHLAHLDRFTAFAGRGLLVPRLGIRTGA